MKYKKHTWKVLLGIIVMIAALILPTEIGQAEAVPVKNSDLFYAYPYHLKVKNQSEANGMEYFADYQLLYAYDTAVDAIYNLSSEDEQMRMVITILKDGAEYTIGSLGRLLGLTNDFESQCADRATRELLTAAMQDEQFILALCEETTELVEAWEFVKSGQDFISSSAYSLVNDSQKKIIKEGLDTKSDYFDAVSEVMTAVEIGNYICFMEQVDNTILNYLISCAPNETLLNSLNAYQSHKNNHYQSYIKEKYLSDATMKALNSAFESGLSAVGSSAAAIFKVVDIVCEAVGNSLSWITGIGSYEDLLVSIQLDQYVNGIRSHRTDLINSFLISPVYPAGVQDYQYTYNMYVIAVRALAESVVNVNKAYEQNIAYVVGNMDKYVSYEKHLEGCRTAVDNLSMDERSIVKGDASKYYELSGDLKLAEPTNEMEADSIYWANNELYYGIQLYNGEMELAATDAGSRKINGNLILRNSKFTIPENLQIQLDGDMLTRSQHISTSCISQLNIYGGLIVKGDVYQTNAGVLRINMGEESPYFEVSGDLAVGDYEYDYGYLNVSSGKIVLNGSNIYIPHLESLGTAELYINTTEASNINLGILKLQGGTTPVQLKITETDSGEFELNGNADDYNLTRGRKIRVTDSLELGKADISYATLAVDGSVKMTGNCNMRGTTLNVSGTLEVGGDCLIYSQYTSTSLRSVITITGDMKVGGSLSEQSAGVLSVIMNEESSRLEVDGATSAGGNEYDYDVWNVTAGKIILNGSYIYASHLESLGTAELYINTNEASSINLGMLKLQEGSTPVQLKITEADSGVYEVSGNADDYNLTAKRRIRVADSLELGKADISYTTLDVDGSVKIAGNCNMRGTTLNVSGTLEIGGDCPIYSQYTSTSLRSVITITGDMKVGGSLSEQSAGVLSVIMNGEAPCLEICGTASSSGNEYDYDNWNISSGKLILKGTYNYIRNMSLQNAAELYIQGEEPQSINLITLNQDAAAKIVLDNASETGVTFLSALSAKGLFNHNRCNFTLYNNGKNSSFIDYDGDGVTDEKDPYPTDASVSAWGTITEEMIALEKPSYAYTGKEICPEIVVKAGNVVLEENIHYLVSYSDNVEVGTATITVNGIKKNGYLGTGTISFIIEEVKNNFNDVLENEYYYEPVLWAVDQGITSGLKENQFAPEDACTRGQVVTFLWRSQGCPEPTSTSHNFTDLNANEYYYKAVLWAVENGITSGMTKTTFAPDATVTRGQFVTFLHRAEGKPSYTVSNPFTDLKTGEYYYDAVLWAVENKVTSGLKPTLFGPEEPCTRGQVVTFLYRAYNE